MRKLWPALCVLVCSSTATAKPLTHGQKVATAGITLVASAWSTSFSWATADVTLQHVCIACENAAPPPPTDYRPLYGYLPLAGNWIQLGRTAARFPDDRAVGASNANLAANLMPYLVPGTVELVGLALVLVGSLEGRRHR